MSDKNKQSDTREKSRYFLDELFNAIGRLEGLFETIENDLSPYPADIVMTLAVTSTNRIHSIGRVLPSVNMHRGYTLMGYNRSLNSLELEGLPE